MKIKKIIFTSVAALMLSTSISCADQVIAKYNGVEVKESQINDVMKMMTNGTKTFSDFPAEMRSNVIKGFVTSELLFQEASKSDVEKNAEYQKELDQAKRITMQKYFLKEKVKNSVSEDDVKAEYKKNADSIKGQEEVKVKHILVKEEAEAKKIMKELDKKGKNFEEIAKKHSIDSSKATGGDLGYLRKGQAVMEFEKAAFETKPGTISAPIKTDFGWHIIKVDEKRAVSVPTYDEQKDLIRSQLEEKKVQEYAEDLYKNAKVEILIDEKK